MRTDLAQRQRGTDEQSGKVTGADGLGYTRRSTRMSRKEADALVSAGVPLIFDLYGHGRLEWCDGEDALRAWQDSRPYVVATEPTIKQLAKHEMWTAGLWESDDGRRVLYLTGRC